MEIKSRFILIFCIVHFYAIHASITIQRRKQQFLRQELIFDLESYKNAKLTYAVCEKTDLTNERRCQVVRETVPYTNNIRSCHFTIKADNHTNKDKEIEENLFVTPFGSDNVIFYLASGDKDINIKLKVIQLQDCQIFETAITIMSPEKPEIHPVVIVPYNDSYDVFYRNGTSGSYKLTIDNKGKIVDKPTIAFESSIFSSLYPYVIPMPKQSRNEGYFYKEHVKGSDDEYNFTINKPDGTKKSLGTHKAYYPTVKSIANNLIGVCFKSHISLPNFKCTQYDADGNLILETTLTSSLNKTIIGHNYNLPGGGFFVVMAKCETQKCHINEIRFSVIKINSIGEIAGSFDMQGIQRKLGKSGMIVMSIYVNENNEYCVSLVEFESTNSWSPRNGYIDSTSNCFTDADFSNKTMKK